MQRALKILKTTYGYGAFRHHQADIIANLIAGRDVLTLMPTGGGKSLCYQIPALVRPGTGVVVSPLIALMQDQVDALKQLGIRAAFLNSTQPVAVKSILQAFALSRILIVTWPPGLVNFNAFERSTFNSE